MHIVRGPMGEADQPDWRPLRRLVPDSLVETRRYVFLSDRGAAYVYLGADRYSRVPAATALELALAPWWEVLGASAEETATAWAALAAARGGG